MRWTLKQFTMALNNAQRASTPRSLGSYLREAWQRVSISGPSLLNHMMASEAFRYMAAFLKVEGTSLLCRYA